MSTQTPTLSDWIAIGTVVVLGSLAIFGPLIVDWLNRWLRGPKLKIEYEHKPPQARKSSRKFYLFPDLRETYFDFHIQVGNKGRTKASTVEAVLEELWTYDVVDRPHKLKGFWAVRLRYDATGRESIDINPHRQRPWNLAYIPSPKMQPEYMKLDRFVDVPGKGEKGLRLFLDVAEMPFFQPNVLLPGKYKIKVSLYSENAKLESQYFVIDWGGEWTDDEEQMLKKIVIDP